MVLVPFLGTLETVYLDDRTRSKGDNMTNALIKKTPSVRRSEQAAVKQAIMDALIILGVTKGAKK